MAIEVAVMLEDPSGEAVRAESAGDEAARLRAMVDRHLLFVARSLRALGVRDADIEDATQQVFIIASRKLGAIEPGREGAFLFQTAAHVSMHVRRHHARRREVDGAELETRSDPAASPDALLDQRRARKLLDEALDAMAPELRSVLVLFEIEEKTTPEIAEMLEIPLGTAASRLRRAREEFQAQVKRLRARGSFPGGGSR